ncbi:1-acyl-sn-glycerol-3-phosphate acyltransferase [Arthrobacter pigmenti]|uniref:1-acyl-sn-glycerol-3-phosphate acyltransferase n=1 Tax=Arthrobacter pigmenti TaxID=271432 RepID=A0A846RFK5_9MICC|nr:lysophospholipid acyltransferase family protein [Arthrobacter pigmenti]NJC21873.1 1-acyl-sn-glycerol-3-phosphate acyltransferase [Arthrobacter pigmenti]
MTWTPRPSNRFYRLVVRSGLLLRWIFRIRIIVSGQENLPPTEPRTGLSRTPEPGRGAVFAITHFGYVDFAFAELVLWKHSNAQLKFLITKAAASHWLAGPAIHACGHVVVDRSAGAAAYEGALQKLRDGEYVAILPEAGVSRSFTVRELKTGAVRLAAEAGVPLIPISVWGAHRLLTRGHPFSPSRAWRAPVRVHISEPIRHSPESDVVGETGQLRAELQDGIDRGIADFPLRPPAGTWWQPAHLGGGAMTEAERVAADQHDAETGRYRRG